MKLKIVLDAIELINQFKQGLIDVRYTVFQLREIISPMNPGEWDAATTINVALSNQNGANSSKYNCTKSALCLVKNP